MTSKSALLAAVAGGISAAVVIAMASGVSPTRAMAHGDPHGPAHDSGHDVGHDTDHDAGHGESHDSDAHADTGEPEHGASGGHGAVDGHGPDTHAPAKKPAPAGKPPAKATSAPAAPAHADTKPTTGHDDPHASDPTHAGKASAAPSAGHAVTGTVTADEAMKMLMEGNDRWVAGKTTSPNTDAARRKEVADNGQTPFVTILTCADSRLPVERIVDRGVGEVFTIRVAGNIAGTSETGTVEYGLGHLNTPLLVVMGHTKCGAVAAAASGAEVHGKIADIVDAIEPAVARAKRKNPALEGAELTAASVKENVWQSVFGLIRESKDIRKLVAEGKVKVVGAVCDISTGKIEWLGEHPWQHEMIDALAEAGDAKVPAAAGH
jgi:carbonic anhydrase